MFEREYRDLAHVPRWVIVPVVKRQTVAEHSYYVALYTNHICRTLKMDPESTMLAVTYALEHDRSEVYTGDQPGPSKRSMVDKEKANKYIEFMDKKAFGNVLDRHPLNDAIVKVADLMDEYAYWSEECRLGNTYFRHIASHICDRLGLAVDRLQEEWAKCGGEYVDMGECLLSPFYSNSTKEKVVPENSSDVASNR